MAELVEDDVNGLLFKSGDSQDLAQNLVRVLDDGDLLPKLRSGISPVKSVLQEMNELESIYQNVIGAENSRMNVEVA